MVDISVAYNAGNKTHQEHKAPLRGGDGRITLNLESDTAQGGAVRTGSIKKGTVKLRFNLLIEDYEQITKGDVYSRFVDPYKTLTDDGKGKLIDETGKEFGSIDYARRRLTFLPDTTVKIPKARYTKTKIGEQVLEQTRVDNRTQQKVQDIFKVAFAGYDYINAGAAMPIDETALVEVWFYDDNPATAVTESLPSSVWQIELLPEVRESLLSGSLHFRWAGKNFYDNNGLLMTALDPIKGSAKIAGRVDYQNAVVIIDKGIITQMTHDYARTYPDYYNLKSLSLISTLELTPLPAWRLSPPPLPFAPSP